MLEICIILIALAIVILWDIGMSWVLTKGIFYIAIHWMHIDVPVDFKFIWLLLFVCMLLFGWTTGGNKE